MAHLQRGYRESESKQDQLFLPQTIGQKKGNPLLIQAPFTPGIELSRWRHHPAFIGAASFVLGYVFSEDWRGLTLAQLNRARAILGRLTNRAKLISPVNTNAQK
jgi:hypothetical protein